MPKFDLASKSYDGQHVLTFNRKKHVYHLDNELVPGVTSINKLGGPTDPKLLAWYMATGRKSKKKSLEAASIGKLVHSYAEERSLGKQPDMGRIEEHPDVAKIKCCIEHYEEWYKTNEDKVLGTEMLVGSAMYRYGGTIDRLVESKTWGLVLDDYKTSKGFYIDQFLQLAAYREAAAEWFDKRVDALRILLFPKSGGTFHSLLLTGRGWFFDNVPLANVSITFNDLWEQFKRNRLSMDFYRLGSQVCADINTGLSND